MLIFSVATSVNVFAQEVQMATLQHGEQMTAYYGANALTSALETAQKGDIISLSAGTFNVETINKAVTIQGAGYVNDAEKNRHRTSLVGNGGNIAISLPEGDSGLTIEGIWTDSYFNLSGELNQLTFKKCSISSIYADESCAIGNFLIDQCDMGVLTAPLIHNGYFNNSILSSIRIDDENSTWMADHSIIRYAPSGMGTLKNCILNLNYGYNNTTCENCVYWPDYVELVGSGNRGLTDDEHNAFFKEGPEAWDYGNGEFNCELSNPSAYLGSDGTQVGIYGGETPFTDVPTNPQVTKKEIAKQASADGKLSVKITVEAQK